ncbi:uncharacterized protein A4U43_C07F14960 [Asparagus officinalis]|uniref:MSP domain-containing protein n=1 Tax=Asparagus officinalis TaxID=4686 RepID=A0A5P1EF00_ASPOF|nr:vesicle-associated protein 1-3-like [Asparagus officinalis]ONK63419.1 uncharacterized protein A4U43_C07F14960 [Asparagus officinalis]
MELLEIQPRELKFTFELKKQSSCTVHLVNKSNEYVAFKVKTTSPKRYCVRPNTGIVLPRSTCDFTVTMQASRTAPPDMQLKDKFLIQSTIAPYGSADEDIVPSMFSKENGRYIDESKLRVVLVSPPHSPALQPINGALKQEPVNEAPLVKEAPIMKEAPCLKEAPIMKEAPFVKESPIMKETPVAKETLVRKDYTPLNEVHDLPISHVKDFEDLKVKVINLESKLNEADKTIVILREEKSFAIQERDKLQQEVALLRRRCAAKVQVGFPFLFVVFMALVGASLGYLLRQ